jgi:hypothetical protein
MGEGAVVAHFRDPYPISNPLTACCGTTLAGVGSALTKKEYNFLIFFGELRQSCGDTARAFFRHCSQPPLTMSDRTTCAACGEPATKRCAQCRGETYCSRACQLRQWPQHKKLCLRRVAAEQYYRLQYDCPFTTGQKPETFF